MAKMTCELRDDASWAWPPQAGWRVLESVGSETCQGTLAI
jgi:hypothetical protein